MRFDYDAIVVGGGPAGLSAALVLGRCRRSVLLADAGRTRNHAALHIHNYLTRDGVAPRRLLDMGRRDARRYGVQLHHTVVTDAHPIAGGFVVRTRRGRPIRCRVLLLATGVVDELPAITDLRAFYGRGVHHCPYCDAWEYRDRPLAAYGPGRHGIGLAMSLLTWSRDVTLITNGAAPDAAVTRLAARHGISVCTESVTRLVSRRGSRRPARNDRLARIVFRSGRHLGVAALFFNTDQVQRSNLPARLGCRTTPEGGVIRDRRQRTGVPGLYLAGDASVDVQFVIVAAAEGAKAGVAMNRELQERDRATYASRRRLRATRHE